MCQLLQFSKEPRKPHDLQSDVPSKENPGQALDERLRFPGVQARRDRSHKVPGWHQTFKEGLSDEPPDSHNVVKEQLVVEPKKKTSHDMRVWASKKSHPIFLLSQKGPRDQTQTSQLTNTQCCYTFSWRSESRSLQAQESYSSSVLEPPRFKATQRKTRLRKRRWNVCKRPWSQIRNQSNGPVIDLRLKCILFQSLRKTKVVFIN